MKIFQEPIYYQNPALRLKVDQFISDLCECPSNGLWHHHKEVELILVQKGRHEIRMPNRIYELGPGDVMLVGASRLHAPRKLGEEQLVHTVLHVDLQAYFDPAMMSYYRHFSEALHPLDELNEMFEDEKVKLAVGRIIEDIHREVLEAAPGYEIAASMHVKHLMLTLLRHDARGLLQPHEYIEADIVRPILDHIDEHLEQKLDMESISQMAGMSYYYFSRYFKKTMGVSFTDYVNRRRIARAERLLVTGRQSVIEIAEEVGIGNMAHFYELFKRYNGCTPKQFMGKVSMKGE
ncbi:helix-turn-helix transcriptional regulator [Paenibacillus puerhi]|uniref:helix-turn-helix transcriptional regulator n=1 Tax=Paenibacillus puerhi TaxID=2692622 RepID=UPI00135A4E68|nr:AraC family transcriptional regulator [Paenibacillus puerhi]